MILVGGYFLSMVGGAAGLVTIYLCEGGGFGGFLGVNCFCMFAQIFEVWNCIGVGNLR